MTSSPRIGRVNQGRVTRLDSAAVREWATDRGYAVARIGRLPAGVIEAFLRAQHRRTDDSHQPGVSNAPEPVESQEGAVNVSKVGSKEGAVAYPQNELLAKHLATQFGNIYEYNLHGGYPGGEDVQEWTDELRAEARTYLLQEMPVEVAAQFLGWDIDFLSDEETKEFAVDNLIDSHEPREIARRVRDAAVAAVPTLDALIGHLDGWPSEDERSDAAIWLEANLTPDDLSQMAEKSKLRVMRWRSRGVGDLTHGLDPTELLTVWHDVTGPPSDLTDAEWELVRPFMLTARLLPGSAALDEHFQSVRRAFNGMLYRSAEDVPWSAIPPRYGRQRNIYQRFRTYERSGVFRRMLNEIQDRPASARIVEWLEQIGTDALAAGA